MDQRRRIKAARALAGFGSVKELSAAIDRPGYSAKTLAKIESEDDARTAEDHELAVIAGACGLPYAFFTVDFAELPKLGKWKDHPLPDAAQFERMAALMTVMDRVLVKAADDHVIPPGVDLVEDLQAELTRRGITQPTAEDVDPPDDLRRELEEESPTGEAGDHPDVPEDRPAEGGTG